MADISDLARAPRGFQRPRDTMNTTARMIDPGKIARPGQQLLSGLEGYSLIIKVDVGK